MLEWLFLATFVASRKVYLVKQILNITHILKQYGHFVFKVVFYMQ